MSHLRYRPSRMAAAILALLTILPADTVRSDEPPGDFIDLFRVPKEYQNDLGSYRSPLKFNDGRPVRTPEEWRERRGEILKIWHDAMGAWPPAVEKPVIEVGKATRRDGFTQNAVRLRVAVDRTCDGFLLVPEGRGPFPAMLVVYYEPNTAIGVGAEFRDFALQLARRGFVTLSIGFDPREIDTDKSGLKLQPLSYLAYVASNARAALATRPEVDPKRIGVMGHSYGGKWAMFAACLDVNFACGVWSDPGIVFDETRPNVNYWEPWYLGWEPNKTRKHGPLAKGEPRMGAYKTLYENGHDLHELQALMAPRPFLVSGGSEDPPERWKGLNHVLAVNDLLGEKHRVAMSNRERHTPTAESNQQVYRFLESVLKPGKDSDRRIGR